MIRTTYVEFKISTTIRPDRILTSDHEIKQHMWQWKIRKTVQKVRFLMSYSLYEWQSQQHKMKHNYFNEVSLLFDIIPQHPDALVSSWQGFYIEFFLLQNWWLHKCCHWSKNNSPMGKVSTICWIFLKFPDCSNILCYSYTVLKDHTSWQMFMPLPANSLMQLSKHLRAYVHIHFCISQYEYKADDSCII